MLKNIIKNIKLELLCFAILMAGLYIFDSRIGIDSVNWIDYFSLDRLGRISDFFAIVIAIYVAVMTIFATSIMGATKKLLQKKLDQALLIVIILGLCENIVAVGLCVFMPNAIFFHKLLVGVICLATVSFIKFLIVMTLIFKINLEEMAYAIDEDMNYKDRLMTNIETLVDYVDNKK